MVNFFLRHKLIAALYDADIRGIRTIAYHLPRILLPKPRGPVTIRTLYGFKLLIDPVSDQGVEKSIYYTGTYEKGTLHVIGNLLGAGDTFVDVGANIGLMSIYASHLVKESGRIIAFEPNPNTMKILRHNMELNGARNIETSEYALGNETSKGKIYDRWDSNRGSATLIRPEAETDSYDIRIVRLSDYLHSTQPVRLIKLDIEGYELEALKGSKELLSHESPPMLIVECSEQRTNLGGTGSGELYDFFQGLKHYRMFRSMGGKERKSKLTAIKSVSEMPDGDNIYCFTERHLSQIPAKLFTPQKTDHHEKKNIS